VAPTSKWRSTSIETRRSRLASERPPKKGVATKNAFRSGELTAISLIYSHSWDLTAPYRLRLASQRRDSVYVRTPAIHRDVSGGTLPVLHSINSACLAASQPNQPIRTGCRCSALHRTPIGRRPASRGIARHRGSRRPNRDAPCWRRCMRNVRGDVRLGLPSGADRQSNTHSEHFAV